jgi:NhaP-type Na+/H+ or K+/H+ antiporter
MRLLPRLRRCHGRDGDAAVVPDVRDRALGNPVREHDLWKTVALAALIIFIIRPISLAAILSRAHISWDGRLFTSWFGPRGLNTLLLALLVIEAGIEGSELLLAVVGTVVLASSVIHGASATPIAAWYGRRISS